jgi:hypothetical protein
MYCYVKNMEGRGGEGGGGGEVYDNINIREEEETTEFISGREKC